jgi:hypothetical protein
MIRLYKSGPSLQKLSINITDIRAGNTAKTERENEKTGKQFPHFFKYRSVKSGPFFKNYLEQTMPNPDNHKRYRQNPA